MYINTPIYKTLSPEKQTSHEVRSCFLDTRSISIYIDGEEYGGEQL